MDVQIEHLRAQKEEEDEWLDETRALNAVLSHRVAELESDVADEAGPARELEALEAENDELMQMLSLFIDEHFNSEADGDAMAVEGVGEGADSGVAKESTTAQRRHGDGGAGRGDDALTGRQRKSSLGGGADGLGCGQGVIGEGGLAGIGASRGEEWLDGGGQGEGASAAEEHGGGGAEQERARSLKDLLSEVRGVKRERGREGERERGREGEGKRE